MRVIRQYGDGVYMGIIRGNQRAEQKTFKFRGSEKRNFLCEALFVHTRNTVFEAFSVPEQYCSAPLLKVELPYRIGF